MPNVDPVILQLKAEIADYQRDLTKAQRLTDDKLNAIEKRGFQMGQSLKSGFDLAKGAAIAFAGSVVADKIMQAITTGLEYASSLGEVAQQLGVTTDALQEYRYAATQVGLSAEEMDQALSQLTRRIGEAGNGTKAQAEAFDKLGVSIKDANGAMIPTGELIPMIADALAKIEDPAQRAAIEMDLFGRAGQKLEPLLAGGSAAVNQLRDAAHRLGIVLSSEQIQKADDAADKLSAVKAVLEAKIAGVVADNADSIFGLANSLSNLADKAIKAYDALQRLSQTKGGQWLGKANNVAGYLTPIGALSGVAGYAMDKFGGGGGAPGRSAPAPAKASPGASKINPWQGAAMPTTLMRANYSGAGLDTGSRSIFGFAPGGVKGGLDAIGGAMAGMDAQLARLNADLAIALADLTGDIRARANAEKQRIDSDLADERERLAQDDQLTQARRVEIGAVLEKTASARKQLVDQRAAEELAAKDRAAQAELLGMQIDALDMERDASTHLGERMAIERRILDLQQQEERARLDAAIAAGQIADAAQARALLGRKQAAERQSMANGQQGPGAAYLDGLRMDAEELNRAFENVQVQGLRSLNDGLVDAIMGTKSLGDVFKNVANQIVADLIRIGIQKAIIGPLANALFGGGPGGAVSKASGFIGSAIKAVTGRASGGYVNPGQLYRVNEGSSPGNVEAFIPNGGGQIVPLGQMNALMQPGSGGGGGVVRIMIEEAEGFASRVTDISASTAIEVHRVTLPGTLEAAAAHTLGKAGRPKL